MKINAIIGSLRKDSYNRKIFNHYKQLSENIFQIEEISIDKLPLYNYDIEISNFPSLVLQMQEQLKQSNGVIFFTPEYNYSIPGVLKNALDWISRLKDQPLSGLPGAIIGGSPGRMGTARAQYHLRQIGVFLNIFFLNKPEIIIPNVQDIFDKDDNIIDRKVIDLMISHIKAFKIYLQYR